ncbi:anti-sigma factor [Pseudonocardia sp. DSM 110487]|uniref:anti-sigma factor n=1 Tax=Pseudonocardia sp. DSM 110487 TaxID=2865833 RepID=UPI001C69CE90|nr:anti-sigma factor [Pseudonocardia sp. DSM 110487]QYN37123.1 anti-sigma factor [Pseudonocardia sp. DSM 110487]
MDDRSRFDGTTPCALGEEAVAFALHALEPDEEAAMRSHIERCRSCSETVRETELVAAAVGGAVEQVDPPPRLRANLLATAAETPQSGPPSQPHPRFAARQHRSRNRARILIAAAAAAVVLAVGGLGAYTAQVQRQRDALAQALAGIVTQLDAPGSSHATLSTDSGRPVAAVLVTTAGRTVVTAGLDPNDTGATTYVVWGIEAGDPRPLAAFDVTAPGPGIHEIGPGDGSRFEAYAVSIEPGRTMPAVPTTVVASGPVQA